MRRLMIDFCMFLCILILYIRNDCDINRNFRAMYSFYNLMLCDFYVLFVLCSALSVIHALLIYKVSDNNK